jgi:hypothetical protein
LSTSGGGPASLQAFCLFIGYPRSGHSLVGSLLDAHPDVLVAHQADAMRLVAKGATRDELIRMLQADSVRRSAGGRRQSGYSYAVEGQWQGRTRVLRVLGDCRGGKTTRRIAADPASPRTFARALDLPLRFVHVIRNPYDNVATLSRQPEHTLESALADYTQLADAVGAFLVRDEESVLTVRHESLIADPKAELRGLCRFLGVDAEPAYVDACAAIVFPAPRRTRESVTWTPAAIAALDELIARHPHLSGYGLDRG